MATNLIKADAGQVPVAATNPATPTSGDLLRFAQLIGIALTDEGDGGNASGEVTANFFSRLVIYDVSVKGEDAAGNAAVSVGDKLYYTDGETYLSKKISGYFAGYAWEAVSSGATSTVEVLFVPKSAVGQLDLPNGIISTEHLDTPLKTGWIPLSLASMREIASDDIQALAAHGGILTSDSTPKLTRVNGATDPALVVTWVASGVEEAQFDTVPMPPDLDASQNVTVHLLAKSGGATDTPTIDVKAWDGIGDTEMGGATAALSDSLAELTVTLTAANIAGPPTGFLNISLTPGAHTTDTVELYAAWIEYTRV